jgi:hypothetical protein
MLRSAAPAPGLVKAAAALTALFDGLAPFLARAMQAAALPEALRVLVLVQAHPLLVRLCAQPSGGGAFVEVSRQDAQGCEPHAVATLEGAVQQFLAGGLSALPADVANAAFDLAAQDGSGFVVALDPSTLSARCLLPKRDSAGWVELFAIHPDEEPTETTRTYRAH